MKVNGRIMRLKLGGKVIAAARSCTMNITVNLETIDDKDQEGIWETSRPTSITWDGSSEATLLSGFVSSGTFGYSPSAPTVTIGGKTYKYFPDNTAIVAPGETIRVKSQIVQCLPVLFNASHTSIIQEGAHGTGSLEYTNQTDGPVTVLAGCYEESSHSVHNQEYTIVSDASALAFEDIMDIAESMTQVSVKMFKARGASGKMNRDEDTRTAEKKSNLGGNCILTNVSANPSAGQIPSYSIQFKGVGELRTGSRA